MPERASSSPAPGATDPGDSASASSEEPTPRKRVIMVKRKKPVTRWHDGTTPLEDLSPSEQLAHAIVSDFGDLAPSVERIMEAELSEDQRAEAMSAFRDSLDNPGDPNRDPRVAIANVATG